MNHTVLPDEPELHDALETELGQPLTEAEPVSGGCIAHAMRLTTAADTYFLKWGRGAVAETFPGEAAGLKALDAAGAPLRIPTVHTVASETETRPGFLLMEWIPPGDPAPTFMADLGTALAVLHRHTGAAYGFSQDNHIGRLPQVNPHETSWPDFFRAHRLRPQCKMARARNRWRVDWDAPFERLCADLANRLPEATEPSVVHGDLWKGNVMATHDGGAALIDPATYYGHREVDVAMTQLFGGFHASFYDAYRAAWPLLDGFDERVHIYNLYHVINHLNHFGGMYATQVEQTLKQLT